MTGIVGNAFSRISLLPARRVMIVESAKMAAELDEFEKNPINMHKVEILKRKVKKNSFRHLSALASLHIFRKDLPHNKCI